MQKKYTLSDFNFDLPESLIAQEPAKPRDAAKLLIYNRATKEIIDTVFSDLLNYLPEQTTVVLNDSRVESCRYKFGKIEVFVLEAVNDTVVRALVFPGKKFKLGAHIVINDVLEIDVVSIDDEGVRTLKTTKPITSEQFNEFRHIPLPPYIPQNDALSDEYQTVYANELGSKAAPTAGLHFTPQLLQRLESSHSVVRATLDVGLGTFAPIKDEQLTNVHLHEESFRLNTQSAALLNSATHITAVGTTSVRILESSVEASRKFSSISSSTDIFISPGYEFKAVDSLITNFHLPKSSLLMLVAAFVGYDEMMILYQYAIRNQYRFYSFGDAMLII